MEQSATITCPHCGVAKTEPMPADACVFFYRCSGCDVILKPRPGDCCVFCSYGDRPCPPKSDEAVAAAGAEMESNATR